MTQARGYFKSSEVTTLGRFKPDLSLSHDTRMLMYDSEVNSRTQIKSMLSAKSFRPSINTPEQATRWLRIFVSDIYSRLVEEGVLENKRRPKTMNLHYRQGGQTRSRQAPIHSGKKIDEAGLYEIATTLLGQIILEGRVWPCANLSLAVAGFEDGIVGNMGIGAFLVKGDEAKALNPNVREGSLIASGHERTEKRRRIFPSVGIGRFFKTDSTEEHDDEFGAQTLPNINLTTSAQPQGSNPMEGDSTLQSAVPHENKATKVDELVPELGNSLALKQQDITNYMCDRCSKALVSANALQSHNDWHFAKDLEGEDRPRTAAKSSATIQSKKPTASSGKKKISRSSKAEKGQSKLTFG
jgi:DNA polymerase eta